MNESPLQYRVALALDIVEDNKASEMALKVAKALKDKMEANIVAVKINSGEVVTGILSSGIKCYDVDKKGVQDLKIAGNATNIYDIAVIFGGKAEEMFDLYFEAEDVITLTGKEKAEEIFEKIMEVPKQREEAIAKAEADKKAKEEAKAKAIVEELNKAKAKEKEKKDKIAKTNKPSKKKKKGSKAKNNK